MSGSKKITPAEFTRQAIVKLRKGHYKGIHSVFSGYNDAVRKYFGTDPVELTKKLVQDGIIETHPTKKGAMLYLKGEMPGGKNNKGNEVLQELGLTMR